MSRPGVTDFSDTSTSHVSHGNVTKWSDTATSHVSRASVTGQKEVASIQLFPSQVDNEWKMVGGDAGEMVARHKDGLDDEMARNENMVDATESLESGESIQRPKISQA